MKIREGIIKIKNVVLDALFPNNIKCIFCERDIPSGFICNSCDKNEIYNNKNRCIVCDTPLKEGNIICDRCKDKKQTRHFSKLFCPFIYDNEVKKAILKFKGDGAKYLAYPFACFIAERLALEQVEYDIIVPVPSHKDSVKARGYNPAYEIAKELSKITGKPLEDVLYKSRKTQNQKFLDYQDRQNNLENSMMLLNKSVIKNKNILIVDDIITTCATIEACAALFTTAKNIYGCAVARRGL